jgi:hypothetical protein
MSDVIYSQAKALKGNYFGKKLNVQVTITKSTPQTQEAQTNPASQTKIPVEIKKPE